MPLYLVRLVQVHESFRRAELEALAELADIPIEFVTYHEDSPFCIINLPSEADAKTLLSRAILSQGIYELWGSGTTYPLLHSSVKETSSELWLKYKTTPFRFTIDGFQGTINPSEQRGLIESFSYLDFEGPIQMKNPPLQMCIFEYYPFKQPTPTQLYLGRFIAPSGRHAKTTYDLKKRHYISTTSMDAELALITANIAQAAPGRFFYDPFMGTGGFPIACGHFGAMVWGSDIDGRSIRGTGGAASHVARKEIKAGKKKIRDVLGNFKQYGLLGNYMGSFISDLTNTPLRCGGAAGGGPSPWLDGIVCDPPYGVREGLKVLGPREKLTEGERSTHEDRYKDPAYIPPKRPYSFHLLLSDILTFASNTLVDNGRLSMWMPTANDEESEIELSIPTHPNLELVSACVQPFNKWSRRLLTYRRLPRSSCTEPPSGINQSSNLLNGKSNGDDAPKNLPTRLHANDLNDFRRKYFQGFKESKSPQAKSPLPQESDETGLVGDKGLVEGACPSEEVRVCCEGGAGIGS